MTRRVLIVGSGGREHALCWRLATDGLAMDGLTTDGLTTDGLAMDGLTTDGLAAMVLVAPGNPGMADVAQVEPVSASDIAGIAALVERESIDLVVIGPEAPLVAGLADVLRASGVAVVGPGAAAARLEGSKAFCREVAAAAGVAIPRGGTFTDTHAAIDFAAGLDGRVAVKADGLAAGKGVAICHSTEEAATAVRACLIEGAFGDAGRTVVIEELLVGREVSVIALCDETAILALPAARDHKRLRDGDEGPNTGGMGAISPVDAPADADIETILDSVHRPLLEELARRGAPFRGVLFAGLMLTDAGPVLLECNVRFGDPETQATLPRLATPLLPLLAAAAKGRLATAAAEAGITGTLLPVHATAAAAVVVAASGYPEAPRIGDPIEGVDAARAAGGLVFCAGVAGSRDALVTAGGRVLVVVGQGTTPTDAIDSAYASLGHVRIPGMQTRRDIGRTPVAAGLRP